MQTAFVQRVARVNQFRVGQLPWILRMYRRPFDLWPSLGRRSLFGAPYQVLFLLYQRLWPFPVKASTRFSTRGSERELTFNPKNTQFCALYLNVFAHGYEPQTTALVNLLVPDDGVFYDIGSNWGWFSLSLAGRNGFRGKVHAFEPFGPSFQDLRSMVQQADLASTIQCHNVALSDRAGKASMRLPDFVQSGLATMEEQAGSGGVEVSTLDTVRLEPPTLMKVDVEGAEEKVFRGGAKLIATHKPMIVFENSCSPHNGAECLKSMQFLTSQGYVFFRLAWLKEGAGQRYLVGHEVDPEPKPVESLALVQFEPEERLLFPDSFNVFACHRDRLPELEKKFQRAGKA